MPAAVGVHKHHSKRQRLPRPRVTDSSGLDKFPITRDAPLPLLHLAGCKQQASRLVRYNVNGVNGAAPHGPFAACDASMPHVGICGIANTEARAVSRRSSDHCVAAHALPTTALVGTSSRYLRLEGMSVGLT